MIARPEKPEPARTEDQVKKHPYPLKRFEYLDGLFSTTSPGLLFAKDDFDYTGASASKTKKPAEAEWQMPDQIPKYKSK